jgi:ribonuclease HI
MEGKMKIYSDGSAKDEKTAVGIWAKRYKRLRTSFRVYGDQDVFNGELQAALYALNNILREIKGRIYIDNAVVVRLGNTIKEWGTREWKRCPQPEIARLFLETLLRKEKDGTEIKFKKIKGYSGIESNEETDMRAKKGLDSEIMYINKIDLLKYRNDMDLKSGEKIIKSNYRRELKKINEEKVEAMAKEDRNEIWKRMRNVEKADKMGDEIMRDRRLHKSIVSIIIKGRTDMLPHAVNIVKRKYENIPNTKCPFCEGEEGTEHIIVECEEYGKVREETREKVYSYLKKKIGERNRRRTEKNHTGMV